MAWREASLLKLVVHGRSVSETKCLLFVMNGARSWLTSCLSWLYAQKTSTFTITFWQVPCQSRYRIWHACVSLNWTILLFWCFYMEFSLSCSCSLHLSQRNFGSIGMTLRALSQNQFAAWWNINSLISRQTALETSLSLNAPVAHSVTHNSYATRCWEKVIRVVEEVRATASMEWSHRIPKY